MTKIKENELTNTLKRKRGRPRKNTDEQALAPAVKRGRGRPRKVLNVETPVVKRGRGRPRKEIQVSEIKPKNPVGRPRKTDKNSRNNSTVVLTSKAINKTKKTEEINNNEVKKEVLLTANNEYVEIIPDAGESCSLDKFADSLDILKRHHEVFGTYSFDFQEIEDELQYLKQDYNIEDTFYNSSENTFKSITEAYQDEQNFSLTVLTDYFRDRLAPRCSFEDWMYFRKALTRSIKDTVAVELRLYHINSTNTDRIYFIHSVDWDEVERQLLPVLETIDLLPKEMAHEVNY